MRMAKLKHPAGEIWLPPNTVVINGSEDSGLFYFWIIGDKYRGEDDTEAWGLAMPLEEAIAELNAAMSYNRYEEAAPQGANSRLD